MMKAVLATQWDDAAVAAAKAAAHDPLDRYLARAPVPGRRFGNGGEHSLRTAGVHHDRPSSVVLAEEAVERPDHPASLADTAVFRRQYELHFEPAEEVEIEELVAGSGTVEQGRSDAARSKR